MEGGGDSCKERETERETDRETDRQTDSERERQRHTESSESYFSFITSSSNRSTAPFFLSSYYFRAALTEKHRPLISQDSNQYLCSLRPP